MDVSTILLAIAITGGVGLVFALLIAFANRRLRVLEDPRVDGVVELLPGSNCGACGFAGCRAFAEQLVSGATQPAKCTNMGADGIADVAGYLGVEAGEANRRVARLLCAGGSHVALQQAQYYGLPSCAAASVVAAGGKGCTWGCIGLADCRDACTFDAIFMDRNGLPHVVPERCTACNDCVVACPKDLFVLMPVEQKLIVQCRSALEGDPAQALCRVACTACGKCALDAAPGLIEMKGGLAVIDYGKNQLAGPEATQRCPTGAIAWVEGAQFAARREPAGSLTS